MTEEVYKEAAQNVTAWYRQYGRDLPWRRTGNPYHIWDPVRSCAADAGGYGPSRITNVL